jgi:hypothetical protein
VVELFDRLRAGDLVAEGRRIDIVGGQSAVVSPDLWDNPDMVLQLSSGAFSPEQRHGRFPAPGPSLPSFVGLTLWAQADDPAAKRAPWEALVKRHRGKDKVVAALKAWAAVRFGKDLPGRGDLLKVHRTDFGVILGINEKTMGLVRKALASDKSKLGGTPAHRRT